MEPDQDRRDQQPPNWIKRLGFGVSLLIVVWLGQNPGPPFIK